MDAELERLREVCPDAAMSDDIEFVKQVGKFPFIVTRKSDGYRYLAATPGADRDEARAAVLAEYPEEEFDVADA